MTMHEHQIFLGAAVRTGFSRRRQLVFARICAKDGAHKKHRKFFAPGETNGNGVGANSFMFVAMIKVDLGRHKNLEIFRNRGILFLFIVMIEVDLGGHKTGRYLIELVELCFLINSLNFNLGGFFIS
jgi:hypothetical protein